MAIFARIACLPAVATIATIAAGCNMNYRPMTLHPAADAPAGPTPLAATTTEYGARTVRLQYALRGRSVAPTLISFQQIAIADETGRACPVVSTNWGKGGEYWASISFSTPAEAKTITANFTLSLDNIDYPLTARLTRIDASRWRVDYGVR